MELLIERRSGYPEMYRACAFVDDCQSPNLEADRIKRLNAICRTVGSELVTGEIPSRAKAQSCEIRCRGLHYRKRRIGHCCDISVVCGIASVGTRRVIASNGLPCCI